MDWFDVFLRHLNGIAILCILGVLYLQRKLILKMSSDVEQAKNTACHALLDTDKLRLENVELTQKNIRLEARVIELEASVIELEARMDSVKHWKFVGHWEEK